MEFTVGDQVETRAPRIRVAKSSGATIERLKARTWVDARRIRRPCLSEVADQEDGASPTRLRSQSSVKVRNEAIVPIMAQQIRKHAWRTLMAISGVPTERLSARREVGSRQIHHPPPSGVTGQEARASAVSLRSQFSLEARSEPIELIVAQPIWKLPRRLRMATVGAPIAPAGWRRMANPSLTEVADQEGSALTMSPRRGSKVRAPNDRMDPILTEYLGEQAGVQAATTGEAIKPLPARRQMRSLDIGNPCLTWVLDQKCSVSKI
ncbi:hypothetical protein ACVIHI_008162 [Bradyrhizobium sp. USDA 4524]